MKALVTWTCGRFYLVEMAFRVRRWPVLVVQFVTATLALLRNLPPPPFPGRQFHLAG